MRKVLLGVALVAAALGVLVLRIQNETPRPQGPQPLGVVDGKAGVAQPIAGEPVQANGVPCDMCVPGKTGTAGGSSEQAGSRGTPAPKVATVPESPSEQPLPGDDKELWDAVQATPAERELARQQNVLQADELDQVTEDMNNDKLNASQSGARIREIGLRHRQRMIEIFGEERAKMISDMNKQRAQQFFDEKYSKQQ